MYKRGRNPPDRPPVAVALFLWWNIPIYDTVSFRFAVMHTEAKIEGATTTEVENARVEEPILFTPQEEKALVGKIDLYLLPTIWIMYLLSYMDRTKYGLFFPRCAL